MPFLDILITSNEDGSQSTTVNRKPTHTDLYLQSDSRHTVSSKYSVIGTLHHRAETIYSSNRKKNIYRKHSKNVNTLHGLWIRVKIKTKGSANKNRRDATNSGQNNNNQKPCKVGLSESLKKVCSKHAVQVYFKGGNTIKISWWLQKNKILSRLPTQNGIFLIFQNCNILDLPLFSICQ